MEKEIQEWTEKDWEDYFESNVQLPSDTYDGGEVEEH